MMNTPNITLIIVIFINSTQSTDIPLINSIKAIFHPSHKNLIFYLKNITKNKNNKKKAKKKIIFFLGYSNSKLIFHPQILANISLMNDNNAIRIHLPTVLSTLGGNTKS